MLFRLQAAHFASDLKKGNAVTISGSLGYKPFKDEHGNTKRQASIVANYVERGEYHRQDELTFEEVAKTTQKMA